ncbi:hypothetical protein ACQCQ7_25835, partial [Ralstonia pseudosolanacearum]|uniref:hypothetical protein n=1 Tax=Ralstonia pseudosolanacearum TaxID=1310165 RepID=UPI003CFB5677
MSQRPAPPSSPHAASALHRLALDAGLLVDWEDAAGRPMRVSDDVLRAAPRQPAAQAVRTRRPSARNGARMT